MTKNQKKLGFTLIELIIVVAIFGLIIMLVFLGYSQADKARKDAARIAAVRKYLNATLAWESDHNGEPPTNIPGPTYFDDPVTGIKARYITNSGASFNTPEGQPWQVNWAAGLPATKDVIQIEAYANCTGAGLVTIPPLTQSAVTVAAGILLESGDFYCTQR